DWEYFSNDGVNYGNAGNVARPGDADRFVLFLKLLRQTFNNMGKSDWKITAAVTADPAQIKKLPVAKLNQYIDFFHVMTYDFNSSAWGPTLAGHQTNLYPANVTPSY
ncbi:MAG: glycosyl hydrolase family 18 protein, partial [Ignavibacterium sp.]